MDFRGFKTSISSTLKNLDKNKDLRRLKKQIATCKPIWKDAKIAEEAKLEGNRLYRDLSNHDTPLHYKVLHLYNESIAYAPIGSEELAIAYSNKSALLKYMRRYSECVSEIDQSLKISQSTPLRIKLLCRKSECLTALGSCENTRCLEKAKFLLSKLENTENEQEHTLTKLINKAQQVIDEGKLDTPKDNKRKIEASTELTRAENQKVWSSVGVQHSEKYGRHLVAKRDFEPGEILFVEQSYVSCLDDSRVHMYCSRCFEYLFTIVACNHCPWRSYCSEECKNKAWNEYHGMECSVLCNIKTASPLNSDVSYLACLLITIFFKALKEAGGLSQMQVELKSIDDSSDDLSKGFTPDGEFSTYKSLYSLPIRHYVRQPYEYFVTCATTALLGIAKYSRVFETTYDVHEIEDLRNNDDAIFVGAFLLKICLLVSQWLISVKLADPNVGRTPHHEEVVDSSRILSGIEQWGSTDSNIPLTSMLISYGCVPNVETCASFGGKYVLYALQPIKAGSQLSLGQKSLNIFDLAPKLARQGTHRMLYKCPCKCEACTENWSRILDDQMDNRPSRGIPRMSGYDRVIAEKLELEVESLTTEWKDNAHKQNYPTIKQIMKLRGVVANIWKQVSMPSMLTLHSVGFMRIMIFTFFNPSEMPSMSASQ